jgi:membrane-bound lytic murein transglycosylase A
MASNGTTIPAPRGASPTDGAGRGPGDVRYERTSFAALAGWDGDDHAAALDAFMTSGMAAGAVVGEVDAIFRQAGTRSGRRLAGREAKQFLEHFFEPWAVRHSSAQGLLTGYYEPVIAGARQRDSRFRVPLYRRPPELVNVVAEAERARGDVRLTHMRQTAGGLEPFATRAEIEAGALADRGLEIIWVADPVEAFFAQVQGSVRIRLPDGALVGLTYDGKNGHPYTSIGRILIERGEIAAADMSMARLGAWLRADVERGRRLMQQNASFVFFREAGGESALGALGTPLIAGRSLAVDTTYHALGLPVFVDAPGLMHWGRRQPFRRLMVAHDVGSAIRGPERGDIFFGTGAAAEARAGITKHRGNLFVLLPRATHALRGRR